MRRFPIHVALLFMLFVAIAPLVSAATATATYTGPLLFTLPSKTPKTEVACSTCDSTNMGKKSVGYQGAISTFTGRYNDSALDSEGFSLPRPLRAWQMKYDSVHDRLYMRVGSYVVAYDVPTLLTRLQSNESLITIDRPGDVGPAGSYLSWDKSFNVEDGWPQSGLDGGDWLPDFDFDDRGLVWLTEGVAWGNVKDDYQRGYFQDGFHFPAGSGSARSIVTIKTSDGRYWVGVSPETGTTAIYDVTDRANPLAGTVLQRAFNKTSIAKTADNHWIAMVNSGTNALEIFTAEDFVFGRSPTFTAGGGRTFKGVATDGTNFYSAEVLNGRLSISQFTQGAGRFTETSTLTSHSFIPERVKYGSGYLSVSGLNPSNSTNDIFVFRAGNGSMSELDLTAFASSASLKTDRYFPSFYSTNGVPSGFLSTIYSLIFDTMVLQKNGHTYLFVNAKGFGDVYEIKGTDSITATNKGISGTTNSNSRQTSAGPFYGDKVVFGSTTSAPAAMNVIWNFGNPESTDNTFPTTTGVDVMHQFSGLTSTSQLTARTITVTNAADSSIFDLQTLTPGTPSPRIGIAGQPALLFTAPNASSSAPIVTSDQWLDASDGTVEGHYGAWSIDSATTKTLPSATVPVGTCGAHSLTFTANYGPYTGSGSTLASTNGSLQQSISGFNYLSRPFVAAVNAPTSDSTNVTFTSASRGTTDTAVLPGGATFTWQWDLLNSSGASVQTATGTSTLAQVPAFIVPRSNFNGLLGAKVRLILSTTAALSTPCASYNSSTGTTGSLSAPDPVLNVISGCQYAGAACSLNVTSASGADTTGWNVTWSFNPAGPLGGSGMSFSPSFSTSYNGTVIASVSNAIGTGTASKSLTIAQPPCTPIPTQGDIAIQGGGTGNCTLNGTCSPNQSISFGATSFTYTWKPGSCDTYLWTFGDGATASTRSATHAYTSNGSYHGSFQLTVGSTTLTYPFTITVGSTCTSCCTPGSCNNTCPQINDQSVFGTFTGPTSGCSYVNTTPCQVGEAVQLTAAPNSFSGFNFTCASSFSWTFGDGQSGTGQQVTHTYAAANTYIATVTVSTTTGTLSYPVSIVVGGGNTCVAPSTGNMGVTLSAPSGCTQNSPNCRAGESVAFAVGGFNNYNFNACSHTYAWDFGDGQTGSGASVSHAFSSAQSQYTIHVTVTNPSGSVQLTKVIAISAGTCPTPTSSNIYLSYFGPTSGSGCAYSTPTVPCLPNESIAFAANPNPGYSFSSCGHTFLWTFGDGTTSTDRAPTHTYTERRTYNVTCAITNSGGTLTLPMSISIGSGGGPTATVDFTYAPFNNLPTLIQFTPSVIPANAASTWTWNFGDGGSATSTGTTPLPQLHPYAASGTYTVTLTTNVGSVTHQVAVAPPPPRSRPARH